MITTPDLAIILAYIAGVFIIAGVLCAGQGVEGFLVNRRSTKLLFLVLSIVSTNIGAGFFLTVAAEAYASGISFGVTIIMVSIVMSLTFALACGRIKRLSDAGNAHTIPELLTQRYGSPLVGSLASLIAVAGYLFITALQFVGIGAVANTMVGFDFSVVLLISGMTAVLYTAIGGIRSDFLADAISFAILAAILAVVIPMVIGSDKVSFSMLPSSHLALFGFAGAPFFFLSILLAAVASFMLFEIWQRVFAAESAETARRAFLISALVQPIFIGAGMVLGLAARLLYSGADKTMAIFKLMVDVLPAGLRGLGLVAVLAILMTTVNSLVLVGGSTLFTDLLKPILRGAQSRFELLWLRLLTIGFGFLALGMAFVVPDLVRLLLMGAFVMMPLCPPIIWSLFDKRPSAGAALGSMAVGTLVTLALMRSMPETAFGPGFLASFAVLIAGYFLKYR